MALHYSGGIGILYDKEINQAISKVSYQLIETDPTKYTKKKWWGEFYASKEIKRSGIYRIELEDGRKGKCFLKKKVNRAVYGLSPLFCYTFRGNERLE